MEESTEYRILSWLETQYEQIVEDLTDLVCCQSPSTD